MTDDFDPTIDEALAPLDSTSTPDVWSDIDGVTSPRNQWTVAAIALLSLILLTTVASLSLRRGNPQDVVISPPTTEAAVTTSPMEPAADGVEGQTAASGTTASSAGQPATEQCLGFDTIAALQLDDIGEVKLSESVSSLVSSSDVVVSGQLVFVEAINNETWRFTIKGWRDELGSTRIPSSFTGPRGQGEPAPTMALNTVAFLQRSGSGGYEVAPDGLWLACDDVSPAHSALTSPLPSAFPDDVSIAEIRRLVWAESRGAQTVTTRPVGDGTSVSRLRLVDGSEFALRLPSSFGTEFIMTQVQIGNEAAQLSNEHFVAFLSIGHCNVGQGGGINDLSMIVGRVRLGVTPAADISICRPDEFIGLDIDPTPDTAFSKDEFQLLPLLVGEEYLAWMDRAGMRSGQCCFENLSVWADGVYLRSSGQIDAKITGLDSETLVPIWTTDLRTIIDSDQEWLGDSGYIWGLNAEGHVIVHTGYGFVLALDAATGAVVWQLDLGTDSPGFRAGVDEDRWIITSEFRSEGDQSAPSVRLVDLSNGEILWTASGEERTNLQWTSPVVLDGLVLVADVSSYVEDPTGDETSSVLAFDLENGERLWTTPLDSSTEAFSDRSVILSDSTRDPKLLLVRNVEGDVFRLDHETGEIFWRSALDAVEFVGMAPDVVTIRIGTGELVDFSLATGDALHTN